MVKGFVHSKAIGLTPRYSSPEAFNMIKSSMNEPQPAHNLMKKMDVYSYGIILYELIEKRLAWSNIDPKHIQDVIISGQRPLLSESTLNTKEPHIIFLMQIMTSCWKASPNERCNFADISLSFEDFRM